MSLLLIDRSVVKEYKTSEGVRKFFGTILRHQKNRCFYCNSRMKKERYKDRVHDRYPTKDHFLPKKRGFKHILGNMVVACHNCNTRAQHGMPSFSETLRMIKMYEELKLPCVFKFVEKQGVTLEDMMEKV